MAASDARRVIRNAPYRVYGAILAVSTLRPITGGLTSLVGNIDKDAGGFNATGNAGTEIGTSGFFYCDLSATEMSADHLYLNFTATNSGAVYYTEQLHPEPCLDSGVAQAGAASTITLRSGASANDGDYVTSTVEIVRGTGAGQLRTVVGYAGAGKIATVDRAWVTNPDTTSVYVIKPNTGGTFDASAVQQTNAAQVDGDATAAANLKTLYKTGLIADTVNDTGATTTTFKGGGTATLSSTDDFYVDSVVIFTSGTLAGIGGKVSAYNGTTKQFTLASPLPVGPANGVSLILLGHQE